MILSQIAARILDLSRSDAPLRAWGAVACAAAAFVCIRRRRLQRSSSCPTLPTLALPSCAAIPPPVPARSAPAHAGSQYTQLITRRVRDIGMFSMLLPGDISMVRGARGGGRRGGGPKADRPRVRVGGGASACFCMPRRVSSGILRASHPGTSRAHPQPPGPNRQPARSGSARRDAAAAADAAVAVAMRHVGSSPRPRQALPWVAQPWD
eukprot:351299-Chlamydomonas_euryale.AAC.2